MPTLRDFLKGTKPKTTPVMTRPRIVAYRSWYEYQKAKVIRVHTLYK